MQQRERGKLKVYIGSAAGVGKTYRMLRRRTICAAAASTSSSDSSRRTAAPRPRRRSATSRSCRAEQIEYRGVTLEEMDVDAVIARAARKSRSSTSSRTRTCPARKHRKRWEDVLELLDAGINVISAVNVQHLESLNDVVAATLGVTVRETVPDWVVAQPIRS